MLRLLQFNNRVALSPCNRPPSKQRQTIDRTCKSLQKMPHPDTGKPLQALRLLR
ncbi:MAG: hypothetical protein K2Y24_05300 [Pseudomonadaceae bacterium]|uniref:hypothetical protein n=1 Tax=Pseudomonas sp. Ga0074129 TaxID=1752219 RepID=UPI000AAB6D4D|nr:hypothetical protein [Pseudomonas sp. Ga0074129]MBX9762431.1 hypothetical protein [Pseudomonadaceae bacterium]